MTEKTHQQPAPSLQPNTEKKRGWEERAHPHMQTVVGGGHPDTDVSFPPEMKNRVMQEPPVAQRKERMPPVLHLLCRRITCSGELLHFIFTSSPPLLILFFSSYSSPSSCLFLFTSSPSSSPPSLPPSVSSSSRFLLLLLLSV